MRDRAARVSDVHEIAAAVPHVKRIDGPKGNAVYLVGGKSFVFFRTPQPDAEDRQTGDPGRGDLGLHRVQVLGGHLVVIGAEPTTGPLGWPRRAG